MKIERPSLNKLKKDTHLWIYFGLARLASRAGSTRWTLSVMDASQSGRVRFTEYKNDRKTCMKKSIVFCLLGALCFGCAHNSDGPVPDRTQITAKYRLAEGATSCSGCIATGTKNI